MLNPFISLFGRQLTGSTPFLAGFALGIYGLTNGFFQVPYGVWSDRIGRKKLLILGLLQLFLGLLLAGLTSNIYVFIFARALQGSGAIMGIAYSWVGDVTPKEKSNQAMGFVGMIVAPSAVIAFVAGPILYQFMSLSWLFLGAAFLIGISLLFILFCTHEKFTRPNTNIHPWAMLWKMVHNKNLVFISLLGVIYNFIMACLFFVLPDQFAHYMPIGYLWLVFAPALIIGMIVMKLGTRDADHGHFKQVSFISLLFLGLGLILLLVPFEFCIWFSAILVMSGFMCMTTVLPSFINRLFLVGFRGSANGILQTFTFLGFFLGPTISGVYIQMNVAYLIYVTVGLLTIVGFILLYFIETEQNMSF
jgi:MFS family permease